MPFIVQAYYMIRMGLGEKTAPLCMGVGRVAGPPQNLSLCYYVNKHKRTS